MTTAASPRNGTGPSPLQLYLHDLESYALVDQEEERALALRIQQGDEDAQRRLVEANLNFVITVAKHYANMGLPFEDLLNEGNLGMIEAARRFDPDRGTRFITYAVWWIRRAILQALTCDSRTIRLPKYKVKELRDFNRIRAEMRSRLRRDPTRDELAQATGLAPDEVDDMQSLQGREVSLDAPSKVTELPLTETLPAHDGQSMETDLFRREACRKVRWAMGFLNEREQRILDLRYGFDGERLTLEEIGNDLDLTKERVRQIEIRARKRLRNILASQAQEVLAMAAC